MKSITTVLLCFLILGCGSRDKLPIPATKAINALPDAMATLSNAGLWNENELSDAEFLENSDRSMIVANLTSVPCRMVFSYVKTSNHPYWMPSQIACEGDEND